MGSKVQIGQQTLKLQHDQISDLTISQKLSNPFQKITPQNFGSDMWFFTPKSFSLELLACGTFEKLKLVQF